MSERSGRRWPPAERSALYTRSYEYVFCRGEQSAEGKQQQAVVAAGWRWSGRQGVNCTRSAVSLVPATSLVTTGLHDNFTIGVTVNRL